MVRSAAKPVRIGVFGGSFDPIHRGHLALARHAADELSLDRVIFIPSRNPLKKSSHALPDALRSRLVKASIHPYRHFLFSDIELRRKGPSYTVDTLRALNRKHKKAQLYFLAGADQLKGFSRWKSPSEVLELCRFVVVTRPGHRPASRDPRFLWLAMTPVDASSTEIRQRLDRGQSITKWVLPGMERILKEHWKKEKKSSKKIKK